VKVLGAFTRRNGRMAGQYMVDMTTESQASPEGIELFIRGIEQIIILDDDQVSTSTIRTNDGWMDMVWLYIIARDLWIIAMIVAGFSLTVIHFFCLSPFYHFYRILLKMWEITLPTFYLACKNHVKLEAAFINAALAVEIMEGIAASLYPELRVQQVALPLVVKAEMMHRLGLH
jgi:hypothetical protein